MSQYVSKYVECPYYRRHDDNRICCEGTDSTNTLNTVFGNCNALKEYTAKHCNNKKLCETCLVHIALDIKYGVIKL